MSDAPLAASDSRADRKGRETLTAKNYSLDKVCRLFRKKRRGAAAVEFASAAVTTVVNDYLANGLISGATVTVTPNVLSTLSFSDPVTVTVGVPFSQVSWLPTPMFLGAANLSSTTVMRRESV